MEEEVTALYTCGPAGGAGGPWAPLTVHRLDTVHALVLLFARSSQDTVTTSLCVDTHGKTPASLLLGTEVPLPPGAGTQAGFWSRASTASSR